MARLCSAVKNSVGPVGLAGGNRHRGAVFRFTSGELGGHGLKRSEDEASQETFASHGLRNDSDPASDEAQPAHEQGKGTRRPHGLSTKELWSESRSSEAS